LVAAALCFIGFALVACAWVVYMIWRDLYPMLQFQLLMRRTELRIDIEEAGSEFPEWLEDDEEKPSGEILHLAPKD